MTWETPDGDRWLTGDEATLVRETLAHMVDQVSDNIRYGDQAWLWKFDVALFDDATATQQLVVAKSIAEHLLTETNATLELTAINEAAVYTIFRTLAVQIEDEIDTQDDKANDDEWRCYWRRLTLAASNQCFADAEEDGLFDDDDPESEWMTPQSEECRKLEQWTCLTESLADRILWDRDFERAGSFLDAEPATAAVIKQMMGIESDYYSNAAPDLKADEVDAMLKSVRQLTHQKPR